MRIATDDYKNGENFTIWVNVRVGVERVGNMKFTKGSHVLVGGTLRTSTYQTKNGETAVSIDVTADSINYIKGGSSASTQTTDAVTDTGKFTEKPAKATAAAATADSADDE
jgi:single-stranded DNA-binding protein